MPQSERQCCKALLWSLHLQPQHRQQQRWWQQQHPYTPMPSMPTTALTTISHHLCQTCCSTLGSSLISSPSATKLGAVEAARRTAAWHTAAAQHQAGAFPTASTAAAAAAELAMPHVSPPAAFSARRYTPQARLRRPLQHQATSRLQGRAVTYLPTGQHSRQAGEIGGRVATLTSAQPPRPDQPFAPTHCCFAVVVLVEVPACVQQHQRMFCVCWLSFLHHVAKQGLLPWLLVCGLVCRLGLGTAHAAAHWAAGKTPGLP